MLFGGQTFFEFLAALAILHKDDLKNRMNSSFSSYHPGAINPFLPVILVQNRQRGKELNKFCPPNSSDDLYLFFCINPSSMDDRQCPPTSMSMCLISLGTLPVMLQLSSCKSRPENRYENLKNCSAFAPFCPTCSEQKSNKCYSTVIYSTVALLQQI